MPSCAAARWHAPMRGPAIRRRWRGIWARAKSSTTRSHRLPWPTPTRRRSIMPHCSRRSRRRRKRWRSEPSQGVTGPSRPTRAIDPNDINVTLSGNGFRRKEAISSPRCGQPMRCWHAQRRRDRRSDPVLRAGSRAPAKASGRKSRPTVQMHLKAAMSTPTIPGPDPDTKTPKFKLPSLACDAHCHIFGPGAKYPYAADRPYTPPDAPLEAFRALHAKLGIGRAVIVNASVHGIDNRVARDAIAASHGAYRAVANINDAITERELRELHDGGFRGCRFNFVRHLGGVPDMRVFDRVVRMIAALGWHVDLHFDAVDLPEYAQMLARLPVRYTIDHMARVKAADGLDQLSFRTLIDLMKRDEKCWVKVCGCERVSSAGPPFVDAVPFARGIVETAPDRVIWGTDWPHPNVKAMPNDGDLVDLIPLFAPEPELQQKILVTNPARLFEFDS